MSLWGNRKKSVNVPLLYLSTIGESVGYAVKADVQKVVIELYTVEVATT